MLKLGDHELQMRDHCLRTDRSGLSLPTRRALNAALQSVPVCLHAGLRIAVPLAGPAILRFEGYQTKFRKGLRRMISLFNKARLHAIADLMSDDPNDVMVGDFWDRIPACEYAGRNPPLTPSQWIDFAHWYSEESSGLSDDMIECLGRYQAPEDPT